MRRHGRRYARGLGRWRPGPLAGESLADTSTWADEVRGRMRHTAPWHYVDVPLNEPKYNAKFSADDSKHGCVVDKINELRKKLLVTSQSRSRICGLLCGS